jgi:hypothetical protein
MRKRRGTERILTFDPRFGGFAGIKDRYCTTTTPGEVIVHHYTTAPQSRNAELLV